MGRSKGRSLPPPPPTSRGKPENGHKTQRAVAVLLLGHWRVTSSPSSTPVVKTGQAGQDRDNPWLAHAHGHNFAPASLPGVWLRWPRWRSRGECAPDCLPARLPHVSAHAALFLQSRCSRLGRGCRGCRAGPTASTHYRLRRMDRNAGSLKALALCKVRAVRCLPRDIVTAGSSTLAGRVAGQIRFGMRRVGGYP